MSFSELFVTYHPQLHIYLTVTVFPQKLLGIFDIIRINKIVL